jgi:hypothetical protein
MSEPFVPTHAIPSGGTRVWADPDGTVPPVARLKGGATVRRLEARGDWACVVAIDGLTGWVDARQLVDASAMPSTTAPATKPVTKPVTKTAPEAAASSATEAAVQSDPEPEVAIAPTPTPTPTPVAEPASRVGGIDLRGMSVVTLIGSAAIAVGSFLSWWSVGGASANGWDLPFEFVLTGKGGDGFKSGPVFVALAVLLLIPVLLGKPYRPAFTALLGTVGFALAALAVARGVNQDPSIYPAIGLLVILGGSALVVTDSTPWWNLRTAEAQR